MTKLRVHAFAVSADGYGAGTNQSLQNPLGVGGTGLHEWSFASRTFQNMFGNDTGETGIDDGFIARGFDNIGAWIIGRNMFGPQRGPWPDDGWQGWWGDNPPYHVPVFVLTHHARPALPMAGGTTFHFLAGEPADVLAQAKAAAAGRDVRLGGGVATLRQFLRAGLVDDMHLAISPVLLGRGEPLFAELDLPALGYRSTGWTMGERAMHLQFQRDS